MTAETISNNRIAPRARVLKSAKLISMNQVSVFDCTIRDMSATGARLLCAEPLSVPNIFQFMVPSENSIRDARVVWRREGMVGIEFTSEKAKPSFRRQ
jgi:PilZ domain